MTKTKQKKKETAIAFPVTFRQTLEDYRGDIMQTLAGSLDTDRFINVALMAVTKNTDIQKCSPASVLLAVMESARVGLQLDNKEAALIPYSGQAIFMPMVQGIINLMLRSPGVLKVEAHIVLEGDFFAYHFGLNPKLEHVPSLEVKGDRKITHSYSIVWREATTPTFEVMDIEELLHVRSMAQSPNSPAYKYYEREMYRKIPLKRLSKYVDLSPEASRAIAVDHAVTGDPYIAGSLDGASDEYQNQLTKAQSIAKLKLLKEKIKPKDSGDEPEEEKAKPPEIIEGEVSEPKPDPETEAIVEAAPIRAKNHWEDYILDFVVTEQFVSGADEKEMRIHARGILNHSPFIEIPHGELKMVPAVAWFMAWNRTTEKHPKMKGENKAKKVLKLWKDEEEALLELAKAKCPPDTQ